MSASEEEESCVGDSCVLPPLDPFAKKFSDEFSAQLLKMQEYEDSLSALDLLSIMSPNISELTVKMDLSTLDPIDKIKKLEARLADIELLKSDIQSKSKKLVEFWKEMLTLVRDVAVENKAEMIHHLSNVDLFSLGTHLEDCIKSSAQEILSGGIKIISDMVVIPSSDCLFNLMKTLLMSFDDDDNSSGSTPTKEETSQVDFNNKPNDLPMTTDLAPKENGSEEPRGAEMPTKEETSQVDLNNKPDDPPMTTDLNPKEIVSEEHKEDSTQSNSSDLSSSTTSDSSDSSSSTTSDSSDSSSSTTSDSSSDSSGIFGGRCPLIKLICYSVGTLLRMMRLALFFSTEMKFIKEEEFEILKALLATIRSENAQLHGGQQK